MVGMETARVLRRIDRLEPDVSQRRGESLRGLEAGTGEDGQHTATREILLHVLQQMNELALGDVGGMRVGWNVQRHHIRLTHTPLPGLTNSSDSTAQLQDTVVVGEFGDVRSTT